jgi:hypothetical protein
LLRQFTGSLLFTIAALFATLAYGWFLTGSVGATAGLIWVVIVLAVLEISLSFDNAVVNAAVLSEMDDIWQRRFLTWGMLFAVFGMRILFPLVIVALAAGLGPIDALKLADRTGALRTDREQRAYCHFRLWRRVPRAGRHDLLRQSGKRRCTGSDGWNGIWLPSPPSARPKSPCSSSPCR